MKKALSIILSFVLVIAALPLAAVESSAAVILTSQDGLWNYYIEGNSTAIIYNNGNLAYRGTDTDITIPTTIDGYPVSAVGDYAFTQYSVLESITIPNGITSVGNYAFYKCTALEEIAFPDSVLTIGNNAVDCCSELKTASLGNGVTSIGNYCFSSCPKLTDVDLGTSLQVIGEYAFYNATSLEKIEIPASVTQSKYRAFYYCTSLNEVHITDLEAWCNIEFYSGGWRANPLEEGHNLYLNGALVTDLVIPSTVTQVKNCAFQGCTSITSVTIPEGVTSIGNLAFWYCTNLESIIIPSTVTSFGSNVFDGCNALTNYYCFKGTRGDTYWTDSSTKYYMGDMDSDGEVDMMTDYALIKTYLAGENTDPLTELQEIVGDYDIDGSIDAFDMFAVDKYHNGL